jgi:hypothetical protein
VSRRTRRRRPQRGNLGEPRTQIYLRATGRRRRGARSKLLLAIVLLTIAVGAYLLAESEASVRGAVGGGLALVAFVLGPGRGP